MRRTAFTVSLLAVAALALNACASTAASSAAVSSTTAVAGSIDAATAPFVGSKRSKKYYPASCHTVQLVKPDDRVGFESMKAAEAAGFAKDLFSSDCRY
jgi:maltose-binding protein MalE